jgi:hypothetical protein
MAILTSCEVLCCRAVLDLYGVGEPAGVHMCLRLRLKFESLQVETDCSTRLHLLMAV